MSTTDPAEKAVKGDINVPAAKSKSKFERIEPGLYRYRSTGVFYSVLKKEGKTVWKSLQVTDKPTARRLLAQDREDQEGLDSNLSGLEFGTLTDKYLSTIAHLAPKTVATRKSVVKLLKGTFKEHRKVRDIKP